MTRPSTAEWLADNAPWIFSGVGVAAITGLWRWLAHVVRARATSIRIVSPRDGARVALRTFVSGTVKVRDAEVILVVHPMATSQYWVQPKVTVRADGRWKVNAYIGNESPTERGGLFELMAVANPDNDMQVGAVLHDWPDAELRSDVIEVRRM